MMLRAQQYTRPRLVARLKSFVSHASQILISKRPSVAIFFLVKTGGRTAVPLANSCLHFNLVVHENEGLLREPMFIVRHRNLMYPMSADNQAHTLLQREYEAATSAIRAEKQDRKGEIATTRRKSRRKAASVLPNRPDL